MPKEVFTTTASEEHGWNKWGNHVVLELERQEARDEALDKKIDEVKQLIVDTKEDITKSINKVEKEFLLKVAALDKAMGMQQLKIGIWGSVSTLVTAIGIVWGLIRAGIIQFVS